jgi:hypothetical protein
MVQSGAWGKLIHVENLESKISWHCPFNVSFGAEETGGGGEELRGPLLLY